jgi:hypothetical protein
MMSPRCLLSLRASLFAGIISVSAAVSGTVMAQSGACENYRGQLASLERASANSQSSRYSGAARRQEGELSRTIAYGRQLGCDRQPSLFFGTPLPQECAGINSRIVQMRGNLRELQEQAGGGQGTQQRRAQLIAAIDQACRTEPTQAAPRNLFEALFGAPRDAVRPPSSLPELDGSIIAQSEGEPRKRQGGSRAVCVRACDGFFFPLASSPSGRDGADEMCQALCPGVETSAYYMPASGNIEEGVSGNGEPYTALANASKYQKSVDPACACKKPDQSWVQVLNEAEAMLSRRKGDIIVSAAKAEELSRVQADPKATNTAPVSARARKAEEAKAAAELKATEAREAADAAAAAKAAQASAMIDLRNPKSNTSVDPAIAEQAASGASAPTAGQESAGIGPQAITGSTTVGRSAGQTREVTTPDGERRIVRIIGNGLAPTSR